jgi:hypothetical protein
MVLVDCDRLSFRFNSFSLSHVKRSANMRTHLLAKFTLSSLDTVWIEESPPCTIATYLVADLVT